MRLCRSVMRKRLFYFHGFEINGDKGICAIGEDIQKGDICMIDIGDFEFVTRPPCNDDELEDWYSPSLKLNYMVAQPIADGFKCGIENPIKATHKKGLIEKVKRLFKRKRANR